MDAAPNTSIEWKPSLWLVRAQIVWGVLGAIGLLASAAPRDVAIPVALLSVLVGAWRAAQLAGRPTRVLPISELDLHWRGPWAFDARTGLSWWPDTLDARGRRTLRLAASRQE